jgi:hypothetical protein
MEQLIFFVLGVVTVLSIMGVVVTFRAQKKNEQLANELKNLSDVSMHEFDELRRHVDELDKIINLRLEREIESVNRHFEEVHRTIDSRTDKLAAKFENNLKDVQDAVAQLNNKLN